MPTLYESATINNWRTTLGAAITDSSTAIGLVSNASISPSQLTVPGVLVIDRISASGGNTPGAREYISFTTIALGGSGVTIAGITRGVGSSTAQTHNSGAVIEDILSVTHWTDLVDFIQVEHLSDGTHPVLSHVRQITVTGVSGASGIKGDVVFVPGSNVSIYAVSGASGHSYVNISGATVVGIGGISPLTVVGTLATGNNLTPLLIVEDSATIKSISAVLKSPVSGASVVFDINKNFVTVFTDQNTRLGILGGGTYASTASIAVTALTPGQLLSLDIDAAGGADLTVLIET